MKQAVLQAISIAVLPFQNLSEDKDLNFFAIGFTEDLITDLSRYSSLQVISSHTTREIGSQDTVDQKERIPGLDVDYLVRGSFRQKGDDVRINAQLISVKQDSIIWSNRYDASIGQIFTLLDELMEQLVSTLQRQVDINLLASSKSKPQTSLAAYEFWLMGMEELKKGTLESDNKARAFFQQALEMDNNYSRAFAGLSLSYFNEWSCQFWERWDYSQKGAFEYALKAVELDESNYISMSVLGRLYVYKGEWERAEHFLRKSLRLNPNDTDNLMMIASGFIYLNYLEEAESLYLKALKLNPINTDWYFSFASMLYFEKGDFQKCIELGLKTDFNTVMVDMSAFIAAAYYHLKEFAKMKDYWAKYLEMFQIKILRGGELDEKEALKWIRNVNPFKGDSNMLPFLNYMSELSGYSISWENKKPANTGKIHNVFHHDGKLWEMKYEGRDVRMPRMKGFRDISRLLSLQGQEIHCMELMESQVPISDSEQMIDKKAKSEYRERIVQLQEDMEEAELMNDAVRSNHLQEEYDQLIDHLSKSLGLGGKLRNVPDQVDKARSAVTWRIRSAIKKIGEVHESLGTHLTASIKTGTFCKYCPERTIPWDL